MNTKLYVGNLQWSVNDELLTEFFSQVGQVKMATVILDRHTGRSRGFGFVEMETEEAAKIAKQRLDGDYLEGRQIMVKDARPEGREKNNSVNEIEDNVETSSFSKLFSDFIYKNAKRGDTLGFSIGKKHFTLRRDDLEFEPPHIVL